MINISFGFCMYICFPLLIGTSVLLLARIASPEIARDQDVFFSTCFLFYIFIISIQGWKLDPILIFSQILIVLATLGIGFENLRLRLLVKKIQSKNIEQWKKRKL